MRTRSGNNPAPTAGSANGSGIPEAVFLPAATSSSTSFSSSFEFASFICAAKARKPGGRAAREIPVGIGFSALAPRSPNSSANIASAKRAGVAYAPRGERPSISASYLASMWSSTAPGLERRPAGRVGQSLGIVAAIGMLCRIASSQASSQHSSCSILFSHDLSSRAYHPEASLTIAPTRLPTWVSTLNGTVALNLTRDGFSGVQTEKILLNFNNLAVLKQMSDGFIDFIDRNPHRL